MPKRIQHGLKKEIEEAAIMSVTCPSCGAKPGELCRKKLTGPRFRDLNATSNTQTHQRRLSAYVSSDLREIL